MSAALVAGCNGTLPLGRLLELLAAAHDGDLAGLTAAALPPVRRLVERGFLLPVDVSGGVGGG